MAKSSADRRMTGTVGISGPSHGFLSSLHPNGDPQRIIRIEVAAGSSTQEKGDVVVLVMTRGQCRDVRKRKIMIEQALAAVEPNGVIWVDAPGGWRARVMSTLRANGMATGIFTVRRARGAGEAQIALTGRALRFALKRGHLSARWRSIVAVLERILFGRALLRRFLPGVGFAAFSAGTRPFGWLADRLTDEGTVDVVLISSWRGQKAPYLLFGLGSGRTLVAKRGGPESKAQIAHEAAMLRSLGADAARFGLEVPRLVDCDTAASVSTLIESEVPGRPLARLIREGRCRDFRAIADRISEWLARWNCDTLRRVELTPDLADRVILSPALALVRSIDRGSDYLNWMSNQTALLMGAKVPLVAAHNDLTMANVLGDDTGVRSVVDWEAASPEGLPLTDFRYAVCDAAATISCQDRLEAFRQCFVEDGRPERIVQQAEAGLRQVVGGPHEWLELCIHAGWLRHAANEEARSSSSRVDGSFLAIAQLLAQSVL